MHMTWMDRIVTLHGKSQEGHVVLQERPVRADALLGSADKVTGLAALSDSADYLADVIARSGAMDVSSIGGGSRPSSPSRNQASSRLSGMLTLGMSHLMDRCVHACHTLCLHLCGRVVKERPSLICNLTSDPEDQSLVLKCLLLPASQSHPQVHPVIWAPHLPMPSPVYGGIWVWAYRLPETLLTAFRWLCRYRSLAGHSLRALRLDLELAVLHYLQDLPSNKWACEEEEATEVPASPVP